MFDDDLEANKKGPQLKNLEPMSLEELRDYITDLKSEIERTEIEIDKKTKSMEAASSFFK